jgi:endonuclease/exonuclease/phosphatase (EEP) superfamily protein YafD
LAESFKRAPKLIPMTQIDAGRVPQPPRRRTFFSFPAFACYGVLANALSGWWWRFDLLGHFLPYYAALLVCTVPLLLYQRRWRMAVCGLLALGYGGVQLGPYFGPRPTVGDGTPFTVIVCNVLSGNETPERATDFLRTQSAEVAVVLEVTPTWAKRLKTLVDVYPEQAFSAREGNFGIAVLSKRPWVSAELARFGPEPLPSYQVDFDIEGTPVRLIATHPPPPMSSEYTAFRNRQLQAIAVACAETPGECMVAGDLNATPWCHGFRLLTVNGRLRDSSLGFGIRPTWPILQGLAVIPIDHVVVSKGIGIARRTVGPNVGSDHRPVVVELRVPRR